MVVRRAKCDCVHGSVADIVKWEVMKKYAVMCVV